MKFFFTIFAFLSMTLVVYGQNPCSSCDHTWTDSGGQPADNALQNGGNACFLSGTHTISNFATSPSSCVYIGPDAIVNLGNSSTTLNGDWTVEGTLNMTSTSALSTATSGSYIFKEGSNFSMAHTSGVANAQGSWLMAGTVTHSGGTGGILTSPRMTFQSATLYVAPTATITSPTLLIENAGNGQRSTDPADLLDPVMSGQKLLMAGVIDIYAWDNHGPTTITGSVTLDDFTGHNKGVEPIVLDGCIHVEGDAEIPDQYIEGTGTFHATGTLTVSGSTNFVGEGNDLFNISFGTIDTSGATGTVFLENYEVNQPYNCSGGFEVSGSIFDITGIGSPSPADFGTNKVDQANTQLYAALVDASTGEVIATDIVGTGGTSATLGGYQFDDVPNGDYTVILSELAQTEGATLTAAQILAATTLVNHVNHADGTSVTPTTDGSPNGQIAVTVLDDNNTDNDFSIVGSAKISGTIYEDLTSTSSDDTPTSLGGTVTNESTVPLYVTVIDANGDVFASEAVAGDGTYELDVKPTTAYQVIISESLQTVGANLDAAAITALTTLSGYDKVVDGDTDAPSEGDGPNGDGANDGVIAVTSGATDSNDQNNDFEIILQLPLVNVSGSVYNFSTGGVNPVSGADTQITNDGNQLYVTLVDAAGEVIGSEAVNASGDYSISNVPQNSTYTMFLSEVQQTVSATLTPAQIAAATSLTGSVNNGEGDINGAQPSAAGATTDAGDGTVDGITTITVESQDNDQVDFAIKNFSPATISGFTKIDIDNDNQADDADDVGYAGVTIELYEDTNGNGTLEVTETTLVATTTTQSNSNGVLGYYEFTGLEAGAYVVKQTQPADYNDFTQVDNTPDADVGSPNTNEIPVQVIEGEVDDRNDFVEKAESPVQISGDVDLKNNPSQANVGQGTQNNHGASLYVSLVDSDNNVLQTMVVPANGSYQFTNVARNTTYNVVIGGVQQTAGAALTADATDIDGFYNYAEGQQNSAPDADPNGILEVVVQTQNVQNRDFDIAPLGVISGHVYNDVDYPTQRTQYGNQQNGNAPQNSSDDIGIIGVTMNLLNDLGAVIETTTTDASGFYEFENLEPGTYTVQQIQPSGYVNLGESDIDRDGNDNDGGESTAAVGTSDNELSVVITFGSNGFETNDNGTTYGDIANNFYENGTPPTTATISGTVYENGTTGDVDGSVTGSSDNPLYATLLDASGNFVAVQAIGVDGTYEFEVDPSTDYSVMLSENPETSTMVGASPSGTVALTGYVNVAEGDTDDDSTGDGSVNGLIAVTSGVAGTNEANNDFEISNFANISGNVVFDADNDSASDDLAEDTGLASVAIELYSDINGNGLIDGADAVVATTTTKDGTMGTVLGFYEFTNVSAGSYIVKETQPATYGNVLAADNSTDTPVNDVAATVTDELPVTVVAGETDDRNDFVEKLATTISGTVYENGTTGNVDGSVTGSSDNPLFVTLVNTTTNEIVAVQALGANGEYSFEVDPSTDYTVVLTEEDDTADIGGTTGLGATALTGYVNVAEGDTDDDSTGDGSVNGLIAVTSGVAGTNEANNDFEIVEYASISGYVTNDVDYDDASDDLIDDTPLDGVTIQLIVDENGNGIIDGSEGAVVASTTTADGTGSDPAGFYEFANLLPGSYVVKETQPMGYVDVLAVDNSTDTPVNDATATVTDELPVTLVAGEDDTRNDFVEKVVVSISGTLFRDMDKGDNNELSADAGTATDATLESSVTVYLYPDTNPTGAASGTPNLLATPVTVDATLASNGAYSFDVDQNTNWVVVIPNDIVDETTPMSPKFGPRMVQRSVAVTTTNVVEQDFPYEQAYKITGTVFEDHNGTDANDAENDTQEAGEDGAPSVTVSLVADGETDVANAIRSASTIADGTFELYAIDGDYEVLITPSSVPSGSTAAADAVSRPAAVAGADESGLSFPLDVTILDVNILSFTASADNGIVTAVWETFEDEPVVYTVEYSVDGATFSPVATVVGDASGFYSASFEGVAGTGYVRLAIDIESGVEYSAIVDVFAAGELEVAVYPNPLKDSDLVNIDIKTMVEGTDAVVNIYNAIGQLVLTDVRFAKGVKAYDLSSFASVAYVIEVINGSTTETTLVVK